MKINELEEGVEYYGTFYGEKSTNKYKVENNELIFYNGIEHIWMTSNKPYNEVIEADFEPCEWVPKKGDIFYYPDFLDDLYYTDRWRGNDSNLAIKRNVGIYRTKEEAIERAKSLGWT
jgi:hypothetical protein